MWWFWALADEAVRRAWEGRIKRCLAGGMDGVGLPEVDLIWCHQPDARVMMVLIIPGIERRQKMRAASMVSNRLGNSG